MPLPSPPRPPEPQPLPCKCPPPQVYSDAEGIVQSPNYPHPYCNNLDCDYTILAAPRNILRISIMSETVYMFDMVSIIGLQGYADGTPAM